jgi:hypothetical protein
LGVELVLERLAIERGGRLFELGISPIDALSTLSIYGRECEAANFACVGLKALGIRGNLVADLCECRAHIATAPIFGGNAVEVPVELGANLRAHPRLKHGDFIEAVLECGLPIDRILKGFFENLPRLFRPKKTKRRASLANLLGFLRCFRNGMVQRMSAKR